MKKIVNKQAFIAIEHLVLFSALLSVSLICLITLAHFYKQEQCKMQRLMVLNDISNRLVAEQYGETKRYDLNYQLNANEVRLYEQNKAPLIIQMAR